MRRLAYGLGWFVIWILIWLGYAENQNTPAKAQIVEKGTAGALFVTPSSLSFNYQLGAPAPPFQTVTVSSTNLIALPFSVSVSSGSWLQAGVIRGTPPYPFNVIVSPIGLAPGVYTGQLTISSSSVPSASVNVTLKITATAPPRLNVNQPVLNLTALQGGAPVSAKVEIGNAGGGILNFTATASSGGWLGVSPASGAVDKTAAGVSATTSTASIPLTITGAPSSLAVGTYLGSIVITGSDDTTVTIPVRLSVAPPSRPNKRWTTFTSMPVILLSQAGLSFTAAAQGGAPLPQQLGILNVGTGTLNWTASTSTLGGGNWLLISSNRGTVRLPYRDVSLLTVTIDPTVVAGLAPADYYGQIQIVDTVDPAANTPQLVTVILTVLAPGSDPGPQVSPSSLIFTGQAGVSPAPKNVMVGVRKADSDQFLSAHIGAAFNYSPASATVRPNEPGVIQVVPDFSLVNPGDIERGTITLQFSDGSVRNVSLLTVVAPPAGAFGLNPQAKNSCANLNLLWREPSPPNFNAVIGQARTLELQVVDNCGNLIGPGDPRTSVLNATFSNRDPDLHLVHVGNGIWSGTWKPVNPSPGPVRVTVTGFNSTGSLLQSGQSITLSGALLPGKTPLVTAGGVQQGASQVLGLPIAPGTLITLKGLNLANAESTATGDSLPDFLNGSRVFIGKQPSPILYTNEEQVNVQVPYDVPVNTQFQVTVQRDGLQSLPEQLVIMSAQPGVFTIDATGIGPGVIFKSDGATLAQPTSCNAPGYTCVPASGGETIILQCAGLGTVTPPVPAGTPPPASPLSTTDNPVTVTIAGVDAQATIGTLIPGRPGVYQVTATVPAGISAGDAVPVVVTVAGQSSPPVTMAIQ